MHDQLKSYQDGLLEAVSTGKLLCDGLSEEQGSWRQTNGGWSAAQTLDHLNSVAEKVVPRLEEAICQAKAAGQKGSPPFRYGALDRLLIRMVSPNPPMKVPVPPIYEPGSAPVLSESLTKFTALHTRMAALVVELENVPADKIKVCSPVSDKMRIRLGAWFEMTVGHCRYHLQQIEDLKRQEGFPISQE